MKCNVGGIERGLRIIIGLLAIGIGSSHLVPAGLPGIACLVGGITLFATGIMEYCPITNALGINTCKKDNTDV